ncbi:hypothetical protein GJU40_20040 [Bacillus lacus]|uniref:Zinc finger DksA/TraR C4-type domain-containing protein n=1 Tax=Metabacillus lacus TaxID=1983721 RepID=A0A7X2J2Y3_9BACI|nr:TraR/DksA C4-type zinc finger protein [Metabacillus lacus]MRX74411.1 hypothetical protein [Metabacillus lacus]
MALSDKQTQGLKQQLLEMKKEIEDKPKDPLFDTSMSDSVGELSNGIDNHPADLGSEVYDRERQQTLENVDENVLGEIKEALDRMEEGTYGKCIDTGEDIPYERLEALPYAKRTIQAQTERDQDRNLLGSEETQHEMNMRDLADGETVGGDNSLTTESLRREHDAF